MFFLITVNFVRTDAFHEDVLLPVAQAAVPLDKEGDSYIFLNMNKEGKLVGHLSDLNTEGKLKAHLQVEHTAITRSVEEQTGKKGGVNIVVVLRAHRDARYADVWRVLDTCTKAGYRRWQMRVLTTS
jgi:biopolymer transport protein ExbD